MLSSARLRQAIHRRPWLRTLLAPPVIVARRVYALTRLPLDAAYCYGSWMRSRQPGIGKSPLGRTIVMSVVSDLRIDPRVEREARTLARAGYEIVVIWPDLRGPNHNEPALDWGPGVSFRNLPAHYGSFASRFPGFLGHEMARAALEYRPFAFHAHDLTTALVGLIAARCSGAHAIFDFHEWYSENVSWSVARGAYVPHPWYVRRAQRFLERLVFRHASAIITVCESLAREMKSEFGERTVYVVRNIPDCKNEPSRSYRSLKEQLGLATNVFLLLYQGGVGPSRMIEPIIEALPLVENCVFVVRGPGLETYGEGYRRLAEMLGVPEKLILLPPVPSRDVIPAAAGADAGIWTLPNLCKNFYYALPNKIFEYLAAGLPVLAANFPEARKLVEGGGVGLCFDPYSPRSIAAAVGLLARSPREQVRMRERIPILMQELSADSEWQKIVSIYDDLGASYRAGVTNDLSVPAAAISSPRARS